MCKDYFELQIERDHRSNLIFTAYVIFFVILAISVLLFAYKAHKSRFTVSDKPPVAVVYGVSLGGGRAVSIYHRG